MPQPGATRIYPARWREKVEDFLRRARLVILRPAASPGVRWEIEHTFSTVDPDKVVLMFERMKARDYENVRTAIAETCGVELPPFQDVRRRRKANALITFGPNWTPTVSRVKAPYWRVPPRKPKLHVFRYAFRPVYQQAGVPWQPSPLSKYKLIAIPFLGLILALFVFQFIAVLVDTVGEESHDTDSNPAQATQVIVPGAGITLRTEYLTDSNGYNYGGNFYVDNTENAEIYVKAEVDERINATGDVVSGNILVNPNETGVRIGSFKQTEQKDWSVKVWAWGCKTPYRPTGNHEVPQCTL